MVVDAYNLAFTALLLTGGTLGDRYGRRRLFRTGIAVFVLGSAACALAPTLTVLLAGRVVQGGGAALMLLQSLAILATSFPGRRERNRAMAAWSVVAGVGLAIGPSLRSGQTGKLPSGGRIRVLPTLGTPDPRTCNCPEEQRGG
ncbi:MFS transporter [Actinospica sp. MGRD01-02]|uniref:MFS transporter n=1 Tax=Actinospica acidithermotolerans TaxID=2828514 RepID=A0A941E795_9ACTN|nr:MFS transporter [Actinospica acidithermotolerans]MBR7826386.1 MFS transporter [Actinospica acidithermotolerans]